MPLALGAGALAVALVQGCDHDPTRPAATPLQATVLTPSTIGIQSPIRVVFNQAVTSATALDPSAVVVINECNGLRIAGALQLSGDTLTFTPSQALPYLTPIAVRVQNVLTTGGQGLATPVTFTTTTQAPPVADVSWTLLNSPTNDFVSSVAFATRDTGYILALGGALYRTTTGGKLFEARFKRDNLTATFGLNLFGTDTIYLVGSPAGGRSAIMRSIDAGRTFDSVATFGGFMLALNLQRRSDGSIAGVTGGQSGGVVVNYYTSNGDSLIPATGISASGSFTDLRLSSDGMHVVVTALTGPNGDQGLAWMSSDGGRTFTAVALPSGTPALLGTGFLDATHAYLLGDSSTVLELDTQTGAVTALGAAQGIPQPTLNSTTGELQTFTFTRARFAPGSSTGWIVGRVTHRRPGAADVVRGVILISRDGGATFTRQAIQGVGDNGENFAPVQDLQALAPDFAVLSGRSGLVAARVSNATSGGVCSFTTP